MYTIKVLYFKESGKYYSSGEFRTDCLNMWTVFEDFRNGLLAGIRPGLRQGHSGYTAVLHDSPDHPNFYPAMFPGMA